MAADLLIYIITDQTSYLDVLLMNGCLRPLMEQHCVQLSVRRYGGVKSSMTPGSAKRAMYLQFGLSICCVPELRWSGL